MSNNGFRRMEGGVDIQASNAAQSRLAFGSGGQKGVLEMPDQAKTTGPVDPTALWEQWYGTASKMWKTVLDGEKETYVDPFGLYRSWLKGVEDAQEQIKAVPLNMMDPKELWKQWFEATTDAWRQAAGRGADPLGLTTQWLEMMEEARARLMAGGNLPADPFTFFKEWYDATSETWAKVVGDVIGTEQFMKAGSQFLETYTSFYRTMRRANEEYFRNLQLPTRSDVARVAELVVGLEDKIDQMEDVFEDFENRNSRIATSDAVEGLKGRLEQVETKLEAIPVALQKLATIEGLEARLDRVESKLDKLLSVLGTIEARESANADKTSHPTRSKAQEARRASSKGQGRQEEVASS